MEKIILQYDPTMHSICDANGTALIYGSSKPDCFEPEKSDGGNKMDSAVLLNLANAYTVDEIIKLKEAGIL